MWGVREKSCVLHDFICAIPETHGWTCHLVCGQFCLLRGPQNTGSNTQLPVAIRIDNHVCSSLRLDHIYIHIYIYIVGPPSNTKVFLLKHVCVAGFSVQQVIF